MALTNEQIKTAMGEIRSIATSLRRSAESIVAIADTLSAASALPEPPVTSPSSGYTGRSAADPKIWKLLHESDFPLLCAEGQFLKTYTGWDAYPNHYPVTDKSGFYEPNNISVIDVDGSRVLNCALKPGTATSKPSSTAPYPRAATGLGMRVEMRVRITEAVQGWHAANLLWPISESWPRDGEIDFLEFDFTDTIGAFLHLQGATSGSDQRAYNSSLKPTDWHVIRMEWIAGKSFKLFHDGTQVGTTVTNRVPSTPMRLVLQTESSGKPTEPSAIMYDWLTVHSVA